jgi:hypothetical protein
MEIIPRLVGEQADFITQHQLPSGAIPWYTDGIIDPWDHIECAIALDLAERFDEAAKAYQWLKKSQNVDGSWYSAYLDGHVEDMIKDANFISYTATGVWYHYLFTRDLDFLREMWPTAERGIDFVMTLQQPTGEFHWAYDVQGKAWPGALIAGSSCIWQSIQSGIKSAELLGLSRPVWHVASWKLARAIKEHPQLFDRHGEDDQRFATSWFYPVLAGVLEGEAAKEHIFKRWDDFVVDGWGCKCVSTAPWVTIAESCELIMALCLIGEADTAKTLMQWILQFRDPEGGFKTGIKLPEELIWPEERNTWTSAGVIMAASALALIGGKSLD